MVEKKKTETKKAAPAARAPKAKAAPAVTTAAAPSTAQVDNRNALQKRGTITGTVVSDKMQKTIVVKIDRRVRHTAYGKFVVKSRRFKAHDEKNEAKVGDIVSLVESRPLSREKRWVLQSIIRRATQSADVNV